MVVKGVDMHRYDRIEPRATLEQCDPEEGAARDVALQHLEMVYREHPEVKDITMFADQLGQFVALVISDEQDEDRLRRALDEIARRHGSARIVDFVALPAKDVLIPALFPVADRPRRDLIWQLLVGCIDTLSPAGFRFCPTCRHTRRPSTGGHSCCGARDDRRE